MNNTVSAEFSEVLNSLDKMETITKVLDQTVFGDKEFNITDCQNLCSVLLREIDYARSKISKFENISL